MELLRSMTGVAVRLCAPSMSGDPVTLCGTVVVPAGSSDSFHRGLAFAPALLSASKA